MINGRHKSTRSSVRTVVVFSVVALLWAYDSMFSDNAVWVRVLYGLGSLNLMYLVGSELLAVRSRQAGPQGEPAN